MNYTKALLSHVNRITLCSILLLTTVSCNITSSDQSDFINISGKWKIIFEDNDKNASFIECPGEWTNILQKKKEMAATLWLRKNIYIGESFSKSNLMLELGEIGIADEVYFNGTYIGGHGKFPRDKAKLDYIMAWKTPRHYVIPKPIIKFNDENTIAIKIFSHLFNGITDKQRILKIKDQYLLQLFFDYIPILINYFAIALNLVFSFIILILFIGNREKKMYFYLYILAICGVVLNLCVTNIPLYINGLNRLKLLITVYVSINVFLSLFMQDILKKHFKCSSEILLLLLSIIIVCIVITPNTQILVNYIGFISVLYALFCQIYTFTIFVISVTHDLKRKWLLLLGLPVIVSAFRNAYYLFTMQFNTVYMTIFLHVPIVIIITILFIFYDYEYQKKSGESIYQSLLKKSQRLQRNLQKAKKTDAKPEPREIIHDLISYLDQNYKETYNRIELSKKFGLNENYMMQLFKKNTGITISQYINKKRIEEVILLLNDTEINIIDIAFSVGFDNYTYFHRLFKKDTGLSPKEFRKQL